MSNRYAYPRQTEPDMRKELGKMLDGVFPEVAKARPFILRKMRRDADGKKIACTCVDPNTKEPDKDTFCPFCVVGDTLIRTTAGLKEMKDIVVGDYVFGKDALPHVVTEKQHTSTDTLITIYSTLRCDPLKVTPDHGMFAIKQVDYKKRLYTVSEVLAKDLQEGDLLLMPKPIVNEPLKDLTINWMSYCKKITSAEKLPKTLQLTDDLLWTIGLWLAEGHIGGDREIMFSLNINELDLAQKVEQTVKTLFPQLTVTHIEKPEVHTRQVSICNTALANWLRNECGSGCDKKHMPSFYWQLSPEQQMQIVLGLWEGDGCTIHIDNDRDSNRNNISITARAVAHDAQLTLWQAGFFAGISTYQRVNRKRVYTVEWIDIKNRGTRGFFSFEDFWASKITKLVTNDLSSPLDVYDISVADGHAFIANNTLSHNCHGEGWFWDEIWLRGYRMHLDSGGALTEKLMPAGLANIHQVTFYVYPEINPNIDITSDDRIVEVALDPDGKVSEPHRRVEKFRIGLAIDLRSDNGKLEYWKLDTYTEKTKFLNGNEYK